MWNWWMLSIQLLFGFLKVHPLGYFVVISQNTWLRKLGPTLPFDIWFISWRRANSCWVGTSHHKVAADTRVYSHPFLALWVFQSELTRSKEGKLQKSVGGYNDYCFLCLYSSVSWSGTLKLSCVHKLPGDLVKMQILLQQFCLMRSLGQRAQQNKKGLLACGFVCSWQINQQAPEPWGGRSLMSLKM